MRLDNFRLDIGKLKEKFESTAKYIGIYDKIKSHLASICFDENENNKQLRFDGPMLLGFKQFEATEWVASPMYLLDFASSEKAQMIKDKLPLSVNIERSERNRESLKIRGTIYDRDGHTVSPEYLILRLQTLADIGWIQGYSRLMITWTAYECDKRKIRFVVLGNAGGRCRAAGSLVNDVSGGGRVPTSGRE